MYNTAHGTGTATAATLTPAALLLQPMVPDGTDVLHIAHHYHDGNDVYSCYCQWYRYWHTTTPPVPPTIIRSTRYTQCKTNLT